MLKNKDNYILAEFEFVIDLDIAMYRYIKKRYSNLESISKKWMNIDDITAKFNMLYRAHENPLEALFPSYDTSKLYNELLTNDEVYKDLLTYADTYDTFGLMITFLQEASSVDITILCRSKYEEHFIKSLNPILNTVIQDKSQVDMSKYTVLYVKYITSLLQYPTIQGKHIFFANAKYNMEEDLDCININLLGLFCTSNELHLVDLYTKLKYRFPNERKLPKGLTIEDDDDNIIIIPKEYE